MIAPTIDSEPQRLSRRDFRTLGLASLGGALEFYDFIIFVFFTNVIGRLFFPPDTPEWLRQLQAFGLFAAGYLARPLGAGCEHLYFIYGIAGFCVGAVGVIPVLKVRAFPAAIRFSGLSLFYNVAYAIFGGLTPLAVTLMMKDAPIAPAHYVGALCVVGIATAVWLHFGATRANTQSALRSSC